MERNYLKFFLSSNLIFLLFYPYPLRKLKIKFHPEKEKRKVYFLKKAYSDIEDPLKVYENLKDFLSISDFEDSVKVLPIFLLAGIETKKIKLSDFEKYLKYINPEIRELLKIFENLYESFYENYNLKDTFLYFIYIINALNFKKNITLPYLKDEPELLYSYSLMKFNAGKIKESEKFIKKFLKKKKNFFNPLYDDALYLLALIERLKGNKNRELKILLKLKNDFPYTPYKNEIFLRLLSIYFEKENYKKIIELEEEISPFMERVIPYFYTAYVFEGKFGKAENLLKKINESKKRDSLRYMVIERLIKRKKYEYADFIAEEIENKEEKRFFDLLLKIFYLKGDEASLLDLYKKESEDEKKGEIAEILGNYYLKEGKLKESEKFYKIAYEKLKDDDILFSLLFVRLKSKKIKQDDFYRIFLNSARDTNLIKKVRKDYHFYLKEKDEFKQAERNLKELLKLKNDEDEIKFLIRELFEIERFVKNDTFFLNILKKYKKNKISGFAAYMALKYMIERNFPEEEIFSFISQFEIKEGDIYEDKITFLLANLYLKEEKTNEAKVLFKDLIKGEDSLSYKSLLMLGEIAIN